jgi:hypothetical protein
MVGMAAAAGAEAAVEEAAGAGAGCWGENEKIRRAGRVNKGFNMRATLLVVGILCLKWSYGKLYL